MAGLGKILFLCLLGAGAAAGGYHFFAQWRMPRLSTLTFRDDPAPIPPVRLEVSATPAGAAIFVNDRLQGFARKHVSFWVDGLAPGFHVVRIVADGHRPFRQRIRIPADGSSVPLTLAAVLEPVPVAALRVESAPPGAMVLMNGRPSGHTPLELRGLEPGRHSFTFALDNHLPLTKVHDLKEGDNEPLVVALQDRQQAMYRARIAAAPKELNTYNDFGELLIAQGDKRAAAEVFAEGFYQSGQPGAIGDANRLNEAFHKNNRGNDKELVQAFDDIVVEMISRGKQSPKLMEHFEKARERRPNDPVFLAALAQLALQTRDRDVMADYLDRALTMKDTENAVAVVDHWLEEPGRRLADYARLLVLLGRMVKDAREQGDDALAAAGLERAATVAARVDELRPLGRDALWPRAQATFAQDTGDAAAYRRHLEGGVTEQLDSLVANRWRLELARAWADEAARLLKDGTAADAPAVMEARHWAARHAGHIVRVVRQSRRLNDASLPAAEQLLAELKTVEVALPPDWPEAFRTLEVDFPLDWPVVFYLDDWQVIGPFAATPVENPVTPENTPYQVGQTFAPDGGARNRSLSWTRTATFLAPESALIPPEGGWAEGRWYAVGWAKSGMSRTLELVVDTEGPLRIGLPDNQEWKIEGPAKDAKRSVAFPRGWTMLRLAWDGAAAGRVSVRVVDPEPASTVNNFLWTGGRQ